MTNKNIYRSLGGLDPELIAKAAPAQKVQKKKKNTWVKWASLAACFALTFTVAVISGNIYTIPSINDPAMNMKIVNNYGPFIFMPALFVSLIPLCVSFAKRDIKTKTLMIANAISLVTINILNALGVYLYSQFGRINIIGDLPIILISSNVGAIISIFTISLLDRKIKSWWSKLLLWLLVSVASIVVACMAHNIILALFQGDMITIA